MRGEVSRDKGSLKKKRKEVNYPKSWSLLSLKLEFSVQLSLNESYERDYLYN